MLSLCRQAGLHPLDTFYSVKRFIGRQFDDLPRGAVQQVSSASQPFVQAVTCATTLMHAQVGV